MHALKNPLFKPSSRPSSPAPSRPDSAVGFERATRPLHKLSFTNFRRSSPAPPSPTPHSQPLVQDGSYLEQLSLKLSEAVSKAILQPSGGISAPDSLAGKRPIPAGRGKALGTLISSELKAANGNTHLYRAVLRALQRPLSVLLNNLSSTLPSLLSSSAFLNTSLPSITAGPNPTQAHAIGVATFAAELLETFDEWDLGVDNDARGDGLKSIREGLVSLFNRVVNPLINNVKQELIPVIHSLEVPASYNGRLPGQQRGAVVHPAVATLQSTLPAYSRWLGKLLTSPTAQATLAAFLISITWQTLIALAYRPMTTTPPGSPQVVPQLTPYKKGSPTSTPPLTPPHSRFNIKLPSPASRPPSPTLAGPSSVASDAHTLYELISLLPRPTGDRTSTRLAREAVDVAMEGLKSLPAVFEAFHSLPAKTRDGADLGLLVDELEARSTELPTLIVMPIALGVCPEKPSVPGILGLSEEEYRSGCLSGFGRADECAVLVSERVLETLKGGDGLTTVIRNWIIREIQDA